MTPPQHYKLPKQCTEVRHIIDCLGLSYHVGTALAYICRAGRKSADTYYDDLRKAIDHLQFELEKSPSNKRKQFEAELREALANGKAIDEGFLVTPKSLEEIAIDENDPSRLIRIPNPNGSGMTLGDIRTWVQENNQ